MNYCQGLCCWATFFGVTAALTIWSPRDRSLWFVRIWPGLISVYPWCTQGGPQQVSNGERARKKPLRFTMARITLAGISSPIPRILPSLERLSDMADLARLTQTTGPFSRLLSIG